MTAYLVIYEHEGDSWGAYVPDLPGCVAAGASRAEVEELMRGAIAMHLEGLREAGQSIPPATSDSGRIAA